jgi:hypothetical protein
MNTLIYEEEWAEKLQERLSDPLTWKEVCKVEYTDTKVLHNPYETDATVQSGTRGSAYTHQNIVVTDSTVDINQFKILPQLIDRADLAQQTYIKQMERADAQGVLLNESIETAMLAAHAQWTDFGTLSINGGGTDTTAITVSASNIDDIIRAVKRRIRKAGGKDILKRKGAFIVWRDEDLELVEAYAQANGFTTADKALKDGIESTGFYYMGVWHYSSNKHASGHLFAGVRDTFHLGICKSTYGQIVIDQEPATASGAVSGIGIVSRVDFQFKAWEKTVPVLFDINVTAI